MRSRSPADSERLNEIRKAADLFRRRTKVLKGVVLRYQLDDLGFLDDYLEELRERGAHRQVLFMMGAYFAEVLRRNIGGTYEFDEVRQELVLKCGGVKCFPISKVLKAYGSQEEAPLQHYGFAFAREVARASL